jgi:6-pyruvoyl-tetrahydropterin synthase
MPHIIIEGKEINFESMYINFTKMVERKDNYIIKFEDAFLNQSKDLILIKTTIIENNINQKYYIQLMKKENQITVRLDPITDPSDKSNSVKKSIANVAKIIFSNHKDSDLSITKTNLQDFLIK